MGFRVRTLGLGPPDKVVLVSPSSLARPTWSFDERDQFRTPITIIIIIIVRSPLDPAIPSWLSVS